MKIYLIEVKSFGKTASGYDIQFADAGQLPKLYMNREKAVSMAERIVDTLRALNSTDEEAYLTPVSVGTTDWEWQQGIIIPSKHRRIYVTVYETETID